MLYIYLHNEREGVVYWNSFSNPRTINTGFKTMLYIHPNKNEYVLYYERVNVGVRVNKLQL